MEIHPEGMRMFSHFTKHEVDNSGVILGVLNNLEGCVSEIVSDSPSEGGFSGRRYERINQSIALGHQLCEIFAGLEIESFSSFLSLPDSTKFRRDGEDKIYLIPPKTVSYKVETYYEPLTNKTYFP